MTVPPGPGHRSGSRTTPPPTVQAGPRKANPYKQAWASPAGRFSPTGIYPRMLAGVRRPKNTVKHGMEKGIWLVILLGAIVINAAGTNIEYALGYTIPWFLTSLVLSPILRLISRIWSKKAWSWFQWLNAAAFLMLVLFLGKYVVHTSMKTLIKESNTQRIGDTRNVSNFKSRYYLDCVKEKTSGSDALMPSSARPLCDCITNRLIAAVPAPRLFELETSPHKHLTIAGIVADKCLDAVLSGNYSTLDGRHSLRNVSPTQLHGQDRGLTMPGSGQTPLPHEHERDQTISAYLPEKAISEAERRQCEKIYWDTVNAASHRGIAAYVEIETRAESARSSCLGY